MLVGVRAPGYSPVPMRRSAYALGLVSVLAMGLGPGVARAGEHRAITLAAMHAPMVVVASVSPATSAPAEGTPPDSPTEGSAPAAGASEEPPAGTPTDEPPNPEGPSAAGPAGERSSEDSSASADGPAGEQGSAGSPAGEQGSADRPAGEQGSADAPTGEQGSADAPAGEPSEGTPETLTVRPRPVSSRGDAAKAVANVPPREATIDPRRRTVDDRLLVRAGILSLGIAGAALIPMVVGLQQAGAARDSTEPGAAADERRMQGLAVGSAVVAGVYGVTGAILLGVGARRRHRLAPAVGPGQVGAVFQARF